MSNYTYLKHKKWGLLTGCSIVPMALVAGFVYGFVHSTIYQDGDSDFTSKFFSYFLVLGGLCYLLVQNLKSFFPHLNETTATIESILIAPMALSELSFAI